MGKHLTLNDRKFIEKMLKQKIPVAVIADTLGVHRSTIYREIKKGSCEIVEAVHGSYKNISVYDCYNAKSVYDKNRKRCIRPFKLMCKYM